MKSDEMIAWLYYHRLDDLIYIINKKVKFDSDYSYRKELASFVIIQTINKRFLDRNEAGQYVYYCLEKYLKKIKRCKDKKTLFQALIYYDRICYFKYLLNFLPRAFLKICTLYFSYSLSFTEIAERQKRIRPYIRIKKYCPSETLALLLDGTND